MRSLETVCPLLIESSVSVTPLSRVTVQVRVTMSPTMIEEGEEVREMMAGIRTEVIYTADVCIKTLLVCVCVCVCVCVGGVVMY